MKPTDLAWMGGILDMKGRVLNKNNQQRRTRQLVLCVDTGEFDIIRRLGALTGTAPEFKKAKTLSEWLRRGCVEHCPDQHVHTTSSEFPPTSRWTITGAGFVVVYLNVRPYLSIDRYSEAVTEANRFVTLNGQGSGQVISSLRRLRALGWQLPFDYAVALDEAAQPALPAA